jgi:hypothetical protein
VPEREPTTAEQIFFDELSELVPGLHDWYHNDPDGTPWMIVSHDFVVDGGIRDTLRMDYDGRIFAVGGAPHP